VKNAHLRFGHLIYSRVLKKTTSRFRLPLDRLIVETESNSRCQAHVLSVIGGDTQIAAVGAAVTNRDWFTAEAPDGTEFYLTLGANAVTYRGSLQLNGMKRPLRHLIAISEELAQAGTGKDSERVILIDDSPTFVWASLVAAHGLPAMADWADWMVSELKRIKAILPLNGVGCSAVLVKGSKGLFMNCISRGLRQGALGFPPQNGPIAWSHTTLATMLENS